MRKITLIKQLKTSLEDISGIEMEGVTPTMSFIEIGLDSLLLTQIALLLKKQYKIPITFRQLNEEFNTLDTLAHYIDLQLPQQEPKLAEEHSIKDEVPPPAHASVKLPLLANTMSADNHSVIHLISQQIQLLAQQVAIMSGGQLNAEQPAIQNGFHKKPPVAQVKDPAPSAEEIIELQKPFGAITRIDKQRTELNAKQEKYLSLLIERYTNKTQKSKAYTQEHRSYMADPRVVSGFKPVTKELVYPIVTNRSKGAYLWDLDGNKYVDLLNGFGSSLLGFQPDFIKKAIIDQIDKGFEIGPQHELSGEVSQLLCEMTGSDRVALCNTGSEAVLGAIRIARTVTGRSMIVMFEGSYHGIIDEVLVRGSKTLKSFPAAPGIMPEAVQNIMVLEYGSVESLKIIEEKAHEIAAVLVEPIQSRNPEHQPVEFLRKLRAITTKEKVALIFDEVITGFRIHQGGAQALFGIQADIGTYGKVIGAGLSIGVIGGKREFLDAFDGGYWQYGDSSVPEVGVTYFAGTFVRHPLALAAAKASLLYMKEKGNSLQESLSNKTLYLANGLNAICKEQEIPLFVAHFASIMKIKANEVYPYKELLHVLMREKGIYLREGFPCFMTEAHTQEDLDEIIYKFKECIQELIAAEFLPSTKKTTPKPASLITKGKPPVPDAKLGKDADGNPAWFIADPAREGKYLQIEV